MAKKLRPSGGYRKTVSFQTATLIYDATYFFCEKFLDARSRTVDQMIQAARSGRQNIAEGSRAAATSSQTELRLLNVARSSLEELLLDYEDFLRHRRLPAWSPDCAESRAVRNVPQAYRKRCGELGDRPDQPDRTDQGRHGDQVDRGHYGDQSDQADQADQADPAGLGRRAALPSMADLTDLERWALYARWLEHPDAGVRANALICLINQANYLLDQEIAATEERFVEEGGYSEQLAAARLAARARGRADWPDRTDQRNQPNQRDQADRADPADRGNQRNRGDQADRADQADHIPLCPKCGALMALRTAKSGKNAGTQFWGCSAYPKCRGVVEV